MCQLNEILKVKTYDDIQVIIVRTILRQTNDFYYTDILNDIKNQLLSKEASPKIVNSFKVEQMIQETLDSLTDSERLYCFNNYYTPTPTLNSMSFAFA